MGSPSSFIQSGGECTCSHHKDNEISASEIATEGINQKGLTTAWPPFNERGGDRYLWMRLLVKNGWKDSVIDFNLLFIHGCMHLASGILEFAEMMVICLQLLDDLSGSE
jgi:hypothetical protein